ncbi:hypothetical protein NE237_013954 [Protea cynaroides]|uniref:SAM domain-containing protein n=1 Tax=Protea cynaroides TaxID=273540 RepID=A0A9Q0GZM3_9MAGN|nr:hypothetical protein NE237_013954 [Protea cynaroides]
MSVVSESFPGAPLSFSLHSPVESMAMAAKPLPNNPSQLQPLTESLSKARSTAAYVSKSLGAKGYQPPEDRDLEVPTVDDGGFEFGLEEPSFDGKFLPLQLTTVRIEMPGMNPPPCRLRQLFILEYDKELGDLAIAPYLFKDMGRRKEEGERNGDRGLMEFMVPMDRSLYSITFSAARTYAQLESLNISVPAASQIVDLHPLYNVQRWDLYAWAFQVELDNGEKEKRFKIFKDDLRFVDERNTENHFKPTVVIQLTAIADGDSCPTIQRLVHKFHFDCFSNLVLGVSIEQGKRFSLKQVSLDVLACVNAPSNETEAIDDVMNDDGFPDVRNPGTAVVDLDEGDAICWLNKAHYSLANFTLDELENFLQETNDEVDLQYADDMQEHRKFLATVLQGGDSENQPIQENENDEDEENDVDNEIDIEEALESEFDESQLGKGQKASVDLPKTTPGTGPHLSSSAQSGLINGFTQHQIGQLYCVLHEHLQLLILVFSLGVFEPSRQYIANEVQRMISEMVVHCGCVITSILLRVQCMRTSYLLSNPDGSMKLCHINLLLLIFGLACVTAANKGPLKDKSIQGNFANTLFLCKHRSDSEHEKMGFGDRGINNVRIWLEQLRFAKCVGLFEMHEVDKEVLPLLTVEDLKEMGINTVLSEGGAVSAWNEGIGFVELRADRDDMRKQGEGGTKLPNDSASGKRVLEDAED